MKFVEHRIADRRVVRLIQKWLNAGVMEDGKRTRTEEGTPQGGRHRRCWRTSIFITFSICGSRHGVKSRAHGEVFVVRFADDIVVGFETEADAEQFWAELTDACASSGSNCIPRRRGCWSLDRMRSRTGSSADRESPRRSIFWASRISVE